MSTANPTVMEKSWTARAARLSWRINTLLFLDAAAPILAGGLVGSALTAILARTLGFDPRWALLPALIALVAASVVAVRRNKGRWWNSSDALTRLEIANGMESRLSAAAAGVTQWPTEKRELLDGYRTRFYRLTGPIAAAATLWIAAMIVPLPASKDQPTPTAEPLAWQQTEALLENLEEIEEIDPESLTAFEQALEQLRSRPPEEWYSHSSLEAGESLLANLQDSTRRMAESLAGADSALGSAGENPSQSSEASLEQAASEMRDALRGMDASQLQLGAELSAALQNIGTPSGLRQLSLEQLQKIQIKILKASEGTGKCAGLGEGFGDKAPGDEPGKGGISRGPGTAPLSITDRNPLETPGIEGALQSSLGNEAGIGDVVGTRMTAPEENTEPFATRAGGTAVIEAGAEAVNRQAVTPAERAVLQRYFQ